MCEMSDSIEPVEHVPAPVRARCRGVASRGDDNGSAGRGDWKAVKKGAWHGSTLYFLNGRVWHNDPDPVYVRESNSLNKAQLMCSWGAHLLKTKMRLRSLLIRYCNLRQQRLLIMEIKKLCLSALMILTMPEEETKISLTFYTCHQNLIQ